MQSQEGKDEEEQLLDSIELLESQETTMDVGSLRIEKPKSKEEEAKYDRENSVLYRVYDKEVSTPNSAGNAQHKSVVLLGDVEYANVKHFDGKQESLWFAMQRNWRENTKTTRKVFVSIKVKRVCEVDNINESFRMRFHLYFTWLPTQQDYKSYYKASKESETGNDTKVMADWKPKWSPRFQLHDVLEVHTRQWQVNSDDSCFRMIQFDNNHQEKVQKIQPGQFDYTKAKFVRATLICDMTFSQRIAPHRYPFDCQSFTCILKANEEMADKINVKCVFLPEFKHNIFGKVDPRKWVIDEWNFEGCTLEFGDLAEGCLLESDDPESEASSIILSLKMSRRWMPVLANTFSVLFGLSGLSLTTFAIEYDNVAARVVYVLTLLLTIVLFDPHANSQPAYVTVMDQYILGVYAFLGLVIIENSFGQYVGSVEHDWIGFWTVLAAFLAFNIGFTIYAIVVRKGERKKLAMTYHEMRELESVQEKRHILKFDIRQKRKVNVKNKTTLAFHGSI